MISGIFHQGSGLGNQLFRYVTARVTAESKGVDFGMVAPELFKGSSFMRLDMGVPVNASYTIGDGGRVIPISSMITFEERKILDDGVDVRGYDPEINFVEDNTIIDGEFQDERYWGHKLFEISKWLDVDPLGVPNDLCVIGFRGGEYKSIPELFLPQDYWQEAVDEMLKINYHMKFICVTDDPETASLFFPPEVKIQHDISTDWRLIKEAPYLIIANSSFYILPALLNRRARKIIAPRYWARRNMGKWCLPQNYYRRFTYL